MALVPFYGQCYFRMEGQAIGGTPRHQFYPVISRMGFMQLIILIRGGAQPCRHFSAL